MAARPARDPLSAQWLGMFYKMTSDEQRAQIAAALRRSESVWTIARAHKLAPCWVAAFDTAQGIRDLRWDDEQKRVIVTIRSAGDGTVESAGDNVTVIPRELPAPRPVSK